MTYNANFATNKTSFTDTNVDAFGRLRISQPHTIFESKFTYGNEEKLFNTTVASGGTATFLPSEASWNLTTTSASGSRVLRESYYDFPYHPGKSQLILMSGVMGPKISNCTKRIGYYDDDDGLFFAQVGNAGMAVVERSSTTGTAVDTVIYQSNWNIDKLDGRGDSRLTLDETKSQIFIIDFQWLGVGTVRYGVEIDGELIYVHESNHANLSLSKVYMKTACLPIRYEIVNTAASSIGTLKQICSAVSSEGGFDEEGNAYGIGNTTGIAITTGAWTPILSIKVNPTLNSIPFRGRILLKSVQLLTSGTNAAAVMLIENAATMTTPVWNAIVSPSVVSYDVATTAYTGGIIRYSGFIGKTTTSQYNAPPNTYGIAGSTYTIVARGVGGTSTVSAAYNWQEII